MEIISVTRGDHPSDPWRLSPSIKGMIPFGVTPLPTIASPIKEPTEKVEIVKLINI